MISVTKKKRPASCCCDLIYGCARVCVFVKTSSDVIDYIDKRSSLKYIYTARGIALAGFPLGYTPWFQVGET